MKKYYGYLFIPLTWTIAVQVLLCLPGAVIPGGGWFNIPHFDKMAHVVLFGAFTGLWCLYFAVLKPRNPQLKKIFFGVFLIAMFNAIIMEYIQRYLIANRSFDEGDIIAGIISAGIAFGICTIKLTD